MKIKIYIGTDLLDYYGDIVCHYSPGSITDLNSGSTQSSYTFELPLTPNNKKILKFNNEPSVTTEPTAIALVLFDEFIVLKGTLKIVSSTTSKAKVLITGTLWTDMFENKKLRDLDLSAEDHVLNSTNVVASWSGAGKFYRYPFINFGELFGGGTNWQCLDFVPMFRLVDLFEYIFSPWTLAGSWLTDFSEDYILGLEQKYQEESIANKTLDVNCNSVGDNTYLLAIPGGLTPVFLAEFKPVVMTVEVTDEGDDYTANVYTVPATGTYRFKSDIKVNCTNLSDVNISLQAGSYLTFEIVKLSGGIETAIAAATYTGTDKAYYDNYSQSLDTNYVHLELNDQIYCRVYLNTHVHNASAGSITLTFFLSQSTDTRLYSAIDDHCLYPGIGFTIEAEKYLPDIDISAFLKGCKEAYNLRFYADVLRQVIYIETGDSIMTDNQVNISKIDFSNEPEAFNISAEYKKNLYLKFCKDENDFAVEDYLNSHDEPSKKITLTSEFAQPGSDFITNSLFAYTITGVGYYSTFFNVPRIYGDGDRDIGGWPYYRAIGFTPRLMRWVGLTAGTFTYDGASRATYPKCLPLDMETQYSDCFIKTFHLIDKGKMIKLYTVADPFLFQQFVTVINDITKENFRPLYTFSISGAKEGGYLNDIEFNNGKAIMQLIIKK